MAEQTKTREQIADKIRKLLALAGNNPNEAEAGAALLKAQQLMAENDISIAEADTAAIEYDSVSCEHKWDYAFRSPLARVIAANFRCELYHKNKKITFMGHKEDALIAKQAFEFAYNFAVKEGNRHYNIAYQTGRQTKGVFNSYAEGFISGLKEKYDEQCKALLIVTPPDVTKKFKEMSAGWGTKKSGMRDTGFSSAAYSAGRLDGKNLSAGKKLGT